MSFHMSNVPQPLGALAVALMVAMVLTRTVMLRGRGIAAMKFGVTDKSDFLIPPFALFYLYLIFANALRWTTVAHTVLFMSRAAGWIGVAFCAGALALIFATLVEFGTSFRVGIDTEHPDKLVTTGVFAFTRNPIYAGFGIMLLGEFLIFPNWILLLYLVAGVALFHRQVLREEAYLVSHYGEEYRAYSERVRRYL
jgi:protein-S-isoprenylcysteine O-methyltransferase Ste14